MDGGDNRPGLSGQILSDVGDRRPVYRSALTLRLRLLFAPGTVRRRRIRLRSDQARSTPNSQRLAMSKLMMVVVICMSGALYDPTRFIYQLGPEVQAFGWMLKSKLSMR